MNPKVDTAYLQALGRVCQRIQASLAGAPARVLPLRIVITGGAGAFIHTGVRTSDDIDAMFRFRDPNNRVGLPADLQECYTDNEGNPRGLSLDYQYNSTLGPLHEDFEDRLQPVPLMCSAVGIPVLQGREDVNKHCGSDVLRNRIAHARAKKAKGGKGK